MVAVRYLPNGELDSSFGGGGIFTYRGVEAPEAETLDLAAAGGYLLAGRYYNESLKQQASLVVRLTPAGALDPAFGAGGIVARGDTAPFGEGIGGAALDSEDRLVTIGTAFRAEQHLLGVTGSLPGRPGAADLRRCQPGRARADEERCRRRSAAASRGPSRVAPPIPTAMGWGEWRSRW